MVTDGESCTCACIYSIEYIYGRFFDGVKHKLCPAALASLDMTNHLPYKNLLKPEGSCDAVMGKDLLGILSPSRPSRFDSKC